MKIIIKNNKSLCWIIVYVVGNHFDGLIGASLSFLNLNLIILIKI